MPQDLEWLLQQSTLPEPAPVPYVPGVFAPDANIGAEVHGCGVVSPLQRDGRGDFKSACGREAIAASIRQILCVRCRSGGNHGEYPWKSSFGALLHRLRHANALDGTADLARYYVVDAIRIWEPRVKIKDAQVTFEENPTPGNPSTGSKVLRIFMVYDILGTARGGTPIFSDVRQAETFNPFSQAA